MPSAPTTDSWGWIVWGRELLHADFSTVVGGAPSWKPLPVLLTTPLALLGGAAPVLWLLVARVAALAGLVAAYRLGNRLAGRAAGVVAVAGLVLSTGWLRAFLHGYTEPLAIALLLWAIDRRRAGRPRQALVLGVGVALARPEALPLLLLYGAWLWRRGEIGRVTLAGVAVLVPALWIVPDWIGSGDPFHGDRVARIVTHGHTADVAISAGAAITPFALTLAAIVGACVAWRRRDAGTIWLSLLAATWFAALAVLMLSGYPPSARFFVLPSALVCVLGAAGAVRVALSSGGRWAPVAICAAAALLALPELGERAEATTREAGDAIGRARVEAVLGQEIARAGPLRLRACGEPVLPAGMGWLRGELAWSLDLPLGAVHQVATTGDGYLRGLGRDGRALALRSRGIILAAPARAFVLYDPFGRARLHFARPPGVGLDLAAAARPWRLLVPEDRSCERLARPAA